MIDIDWSAVKSVTIPQGDVKKIDVNGVTVWEKASSILPSEYQQVECISGTGTQYIDTGIECTSDLAVDFAFEYSGTANAAVCGGISSAVSPMYRHHLTPYGNQFYWIQQGGTYSSVPYTTTKDTKYVVTVDPVNGIATIDGTEYTFTPLADGVTTGKSYGIFARINASGATQSKAATFYYFKFYRNGVMIGNFIPCYRIEDGEIGMYDTVSSTFFTNAGSGTFTAGADV